MVNGYCDVMGKTPDTPITFPDLSPWTPVIYGFGDLYGQYVH